MNGIKPLFVCMLVILLENGPSSVYAQAPAATAPKQATSPSERVPAEKSVLAESSKHAAKPETVEFCLCVGEGDNSMSKKIEQALAAPLHKTGLDYSDQPLQDIVM